MYIFIGKLTGDSITIHQVNNTRMIKIEFKGEYIGIEGIHYTATKSKETRNKILALANIIDFKEIAN